MLLALAMNQPAHAAEFINSLLDYFNSYYNDQANGNRCYSRVNAKAVGAGTVYVEWAVEEHTYNVDYVGPLLDKTSTAESPNNSTANNTLWNSTASHKYVFCAKESDNGFKLQGVYTDENCTNPYTPSSSASEDGIYAAKVIVQTSATNEANRVILNLYARFDLTIKLNKYGYSTLFYSEHNLKVPTGVTATTYTFDSNNKQLQVSKTYSANAVIPAGEAVVLQGGVNTEYTFVPVTGTYTKDPYNILEGTDTETQLSGEGKFYALSAKSGVVGFYWMADGGVGFTCPAHKAYLHLSSSAGSVKGFAFNDDDATSIQAIENTIEDGAIYNVAGQRVGKMQKGINIVNGKKIMVK